MRSLDPEIGNIRRIILEFDRQIEDMHLKVHKYLLDRSKNPHPRHEELLSTIFNYKIRRVKSRELELRLESVQFKAANRGKIWKQWFEDDAKGLFHKGEIEGSDKESKMKSSPLMDNIYENAKKAWTKYGITDVESREDFLGRIVPEVEDVQRNLTSGQKIMFTYDQDTHRAQVKIKEK